MSSIVDKLRDVSPRFWLAIIVACAGIVSSFVWVQADTRSNSDQIVRVEEKLDRTITKVYGDVEVRLQSVERNREVLENEIGHINQSIRDIKTDIKEVLKEVKKP